MMNPFAGTGGMNLDALIKLIQQNAELAGRKTSAGVSDAYGRMGQGRNAAMAFLPGRTAFDVSQQSTAGALGAYDQFWGRDLQRRGMEADWGLRKRGLDLEEKKIPKFSISGPGGWGLSI